MRPGSRTTRPRRPHPRSATAGCSRARGVTVPGLPSVARITALHQGGIAIDNRQSGGARISVALPLVPVCSSTTASGPPPPSEVPVLRPLGGASLIIMDDDPRVRKGLRRILESENARVTETSCGEEFLAAYADQRHAGCTPLGILDIHIASGMSGLETISRLHAARIGNISPKPSMMEGASSANGGSQPTSTAQVAWFRPKISAKQPQISPQSPLSRPTQCLAHPRRPNHTDLGHALAALDA